MGSRAVADLPGGQLRLGQHLLHIGGEGAFVRERGRPEVRAAEPGHGVQWARPRAEPSAKAVHEDNADSHHRITACENVRQYKNEKKERELLLAQ